MSTNYRAALDVAERAALAAGEILRHDFHRPDGARGGHGKAPADTEAERLIRAQLLETFPDWGYRGEETHPDKESSDGKHVWLVDPNDGTDAYLQGHRGSAVSIGLVREGIPVLGVIYAFAAPDDRGDLFTWAESCGPLQRNWNPVARPPWPSALDRYGVVLLSKGADRIAEANARLVAPARFRGVPSIAYRLALAAAGDGIAAVSLHSPGDWDYAAGHAFIRATGGVFIDEAGRPVYYSSSGHSSTRLCFAGSAAVVQELAGRAWDQVFHSGSPHAEPYDLVRPVPGRNTADAGILSRAQGCWLGQLAGDALGSLVEFRTAADIRRQYPEGVRRMQDGGTFHTIAGQPTDDSELALMLARSTVAKGGYDPEAAAAAYRHWITSDPFDCGGTIAAALEGISAGDVERGTAAAAASRAANPSSQSNGSLMRITPLAIWGHSAPPDELAKQARHDAALTHPHPVCQDAAAVYCVAIAQAIATGGPPRSVYEHAVQWASHNVKERTVTETLHRAAGAPPDDYTSKKGWVLIALQNAFYRLLHSHNLEQGVVDTIMEGGDTDTNAAIAGALLGAAFGWDAVPFAWMQMVLSCRPIKGLAGVNKPRPRCFWPVDALYLAERLLCLRHWA